MLPMATSLPLKQNSAVVTETTGPPKVTIFTIYTFAESLVTPAHRWRDLGVYVFGFGVLLSFLLFVLLHRIFHENCDF